MPSLGFEIITFGFRPKTNVSEGDYSFLTHRTGFVKFAEYPCYIRLTALPWEIVIYSRH